MEYSVFPELKNNQLKEPMFFGQPVNVQRYDQQKYPVFEALIEKQLSFFWRPEEIDVSRDRIDYMKLSPHEKHIFLSNLKYQTLLDSIQGRSPNLAFLPIVSLPELETWIVTWTFSETIHSRSYTHIIRAIENSPSVVFDDIVINMEIKKRAVDIARYYDRLILLASNYNRSDYPYKDGYSGMAVREALYLCMACVNALEAIRFYVSFACSFAFAERKLMEGNAKIIKLIARDEQLHLVGTQHIMRLMEEEEPLLMREAVTACKAEARDIFSRAVQQEKAWAEYLFKDGSMLGMNKDILWQYIEYIANIRMEALGMPRLFEKRTNPIPWINHWLNSDTVQVAPQETEISSYLIGQIDGNVNNDDLRSFEL